MKILHFVFRYAPEIGGMENAAKQLAERTAQKGHKVVIVTSTFKGCKRIEKQGNITIYRLWSIRRLGYPLIIPLLPILLLFLLNRDIVLNMHYMFHYFTDVVILIARMKSCRIITHMHIDLPPAGWFKFLNPIHKRLAWKYVLPLSDILICPTQDYADLACRNNFPADKCVVIPWGVDTTLFKPRESGDIKPPVKVLFVGRLGKEKNIPLPLEAFKILNKRYAAELHIVGEGIDGPLIKDIIERNNMSNVTMHGTLTGRDLSDMYSFCDLFVLPSKNESFGIVNLEAMASGLPVIASDVVGLRNLLEGTAILVQPTAENVAAAMLQLVEDPDLRKNLIKTGLEKVREYDWDSITERVISLYSNSQIEKMKN